MCAQLKESHETASCHLQTIDEKTSQMVDLEQRLADMNGRYEQLEKELTETRELAENQTRAVSSEYSTQLETIKSQLDESMSRLHNLESELERTRSEREAFECENVKLRFEIEEKNEEARKLAEDKDAAKGLSHTLEMLAEETKIEYERRVEEMRSEMEKMKEENERAMQTSESRLASLENEKASLVEEMNALKESHERQLAELNKMLNDHEALLETEVTQKDSELQAKHKEIEELNRQISELNIYFETCEEKFNAVSDEKSKLQAEIESLQTRLSEEKTAGDSLLTQIDVLNDTINNMGKEIEAERQLFDQTKAEFDMKERANIERLEELSTLLAQSRHAYEEIVNRNNEYLMVCRRFLFYSISDKINLIYF